MVRNFSNFIDVLRYRACQQSDQIAFTLLQDGETELGNRTYQALDREARAIATQLQTLKAKGERALLLYPPGLEFISAFLGCLYAGVIAVPAYPPRANRSFERLKAIIEDADAAFALTTEAFLETYQQRLANSEAEADFRCLATDNVELALADQWRDPNPDGDTLAFLQYTSGSTGTPKGVMVSHGNLLHNAALINRCFQDSERTQGVSWLPPYHDMGLIGGILQPIYVNASTVLMSPVTFLQRPLRWLQAISNYRGTTSGGPNFAYELCLTQITEEQKASLDLSSWTLAFTGAEPIRAQTLERFSAAFARCGFRREAFFPCYGMAETTLIVSGAQRSLPPVLAMVSDTALQHNRVESVEESTTRKSPENTITLVGCGTLDPQQQQIVIVDPESHQACPENGIGEIWVAGKNVAQGYWHRPEQSQQTFQAYLADGTAANGKVQSSPKPTWETNGASTANRHRLDSYPGPYLRTGDLGFLKVGELFITGRLKDLIIIRGRNHYPQDIERTLETSHPALRTSCSAAFSVEMNSEERLVVVCEIQRSHLRKLNAREVCQAIRKLILERHELQPYAILLLKTGSIPKTSSGKIARYACKANFLDQSLVTVGEWRQEAVYASKATDSIPLTTPSSGQRSPSVEVVTIQTWLVQHISQQAGLTPQEIDVQEPFASYGLDSVQAVRLSAQLEDWLGRQFPPTLAYDYPTIATLAHYLAQRSPFAANQLATSPRKENSNEAIAIIGLSCRLPQADNPEAFWQLLCEGGQAISSGQQRWPRHTELAQSYGGFLNQVDQFDAPFFGISAREATRMDPQQRLLLEVSWEALERAGIVPQTLAGSSTGVFIGLSSVDYAQLQVRSQLSPNAYSGTGNANSIAANRLSYWLDLRGPSLTVDTACSSSLVAIHLACQSLRNGECEQAIVGGANIILAPDLTQSFMAAGMMAVDGRCKTFDADADGYVRGEGCGVVILKRLPEAVRDGDRILATIAGSAMNQDGRSNGLTAPNGPAQQAVIQQALQNAGVESTQVSYVETHGTGTALGDPIEVNALAGLLGSDRPRERPCWLGSVKTNIGHLEAAAGIAGLIKTVLCLQHRQIPPHLNLQTLNPHIDFGSAPFQIPIQLQSWTVPSNTPRLAGVSSFGFGGTNAHVLLQEWQDAEQTSPTVINPNPQNATLAVELKPIKQLLAVSAKTLPALKTLGQTYQQFLVAHPELSLAELCSAVNTGRSHFGQRKALLASTREELDAQLATMVQELEQTEAMSTQHSGGGRPKLVMLFTGQGSQYAGMGLELYQTQPCFRAAIDQCAELLRPYLEHSLIDVLYPSLQETETETDTSELVHETRYTQPALFAVEYALAQLWQSWGIRPDTVMGHSVGEYVAACCAGVFSLADGLKLIAERSRLMQEMTAPGEMAAVLTDAATVSEVLDSLATDCVVAAVNGPRNTVISGTTAGVAAAMEQLHAQKIKAKALQVSRGFHSPLMDPILDKFRQVAQQVSYHTPQLAVISNLTGQVADEAIATADYWVQHIRQPVQFAPSMATLQQQEYKIFLEAGPQPILLGMGRHCLPMSNGVWLPSLRPGKSDQTQLNRSLGQLYEQGLTIDWQTYSGKSARANLLLPTYPFQRQRYWFEVPAATTTDWEIAPQPTSQPALGSYTIDWQPIAIEPTPLSKHFQGEQMQTWVIFAERQGVGVVIAQWFEQQGQGAYLIQPAATGSLPDTGLKRLQNGRCHWFIDPMNSQALERLFEDLQAIAPSPTGIIHLWGLDTPAIENLTTTELIQAQQQGCGSVLTLIQVLSKRRLKTRLWLGTRNTQLVEAKGVNAKGVSGKDEFLNPTQGSLWGLGKVIALEHPELWGGLVDLATLTESETAADKAQGGSAQSEALQILTAIAHGSEQNGDQLAWREGQCFGAQLTPAPALIQNSAESLTVQSDGTYLITGGLGALGLAIAQWLIAQGAKNLVLLSRRSPAADIKTRIAGWKTVGVTVQVAQGDVTESEELAKLFQDLSNTLPPLRGVIHCAGLIDDGVLQGLSWERFSKILAPKIQGAWHLHQCTQGLELDFFVLFSSLASLMGSPGQGNYATANAYCDAIAHYRRAQGLPALSINWGPWADIGMAATTRLMGRGIHPLSQGAGLQALGQLLTTTTPAQVGVMTVDWPSLQQQFPELGRSAFFQTVMPQPTVSSMHPPRQQGIYDRVFAMTPRQRESFFVGYLQSILAQIMQLSDEPLAPETNLLEQGLDSLMTMEVINQLKGDLQLMLYPREFYERPRIQALAQYLAKEFSRAHDKTPTLAAKDSGSSSVNTAFSQSASVTGIATTPREIITPAQKLPSAVFLLSGPRCGSTLLRVMLAGHPNLFVPPELHLLPFNTMAERDRQVSAARLGEGLARALMELKGLDAPSAEQWVKDWVEQNTSIEEIYRQLQELAGARLLVDKSPSYAYEASTLAQAEALFSDTKYIHLTRHPYAAIESFCRLRMDKMLGFSADDPHPIAESIWTRSNQNILNLAQALPPERYHQIRYEDLVRSPEATMSALCDFLGVDFDPTVLAPYQGDRLTEGLHQSSLSVGDPNFLNHRQIEPQLGETWREIHLPLRLSEATQQVAHQFAYELPHEPAFKLPLDPMGNLGLNATFSAEMPEMTELYLNIRGMKICLCTWGPEAGPLVLCLHGILEQGAAWLEVASSLAQKGYRVVAPDLRGHGRSEHVSQGYSYNLIDFLGDIDVIVEQLSDRAITLVGHSLGSVIAAIFTSIRPQRVKNLVLVETVLPTDSNEDEAAEQLASHLDYLASPPDHPVFPDVASAAERLRLATPALSPAFALQLAQRITEPCAGGVRWRWATLLRTRAGLLFNGIGKTKYLNLLKRINVPITLVYGDRSDFNRDEDLSEQQAAMPEAVRIILPGGHNLHLEAPLDLAKIIRKFAI